MKIVVVPESGAYEDSSVTERTTVTFICSIKTGGTWVRQLFKDIGVMQALLDDSTRDLYWCAVLKFLCRLFLTIPSEATMEELLGILEPMCDGELVHEFGASESEEMDRQQAKTALTAVMAVTAAAHSAVVAAGVVADDEYDDTGGEGDPAVEAVAGVVLYDVLSHFHSL